MLERKILVRRRPRSPWPSCNVLSPLKGAISDEHYMSIFNWFSRPSSQAHPVAAEEHARPHSTSPKKAAAAPAHPQEHEVDPRSDRAKLRHLRRDQSFLAIREAMTRTGVLSSHYKFKVFSEDQQGNEFVVLISLVTVAGEPVPHFSEMEAMIMETAKARFDIVVSAVYWRLTEVPAAAKPAGRAPVPQPQPRASSPYDTIEADEVRAFQQALLAASAQGQSHTAPPEKDKDGYRKKRSHLSDFEDTELTESKAGVVLSRTQYGDLI